MPDEEIAIDPAFEGPPSSGHGGYTCGRLAPYLPADDAPQPPSFAEALAATASFAGLRSHPYPRCVGCGTGRTDAVALRIFPGPLAGRDLVAAIWYPGSDATTNYQIRPEFAWAALDCPGGWAAIRFGRVDRPVVLGRMAARLLEPIAVGGPHILVGWLDSVAGRKLVAGSALYSRHGALQGFSRQTWIMPAPAGTPS